MNAQKTIIIFSLIVITCSLAGWVLWDATAERLIGSAFNGESIPLVNKYVAIHRSIDPANRTLEYFLRNGKPVVPRLLGLIIAMQLLLLAGMRYGRSIVSKFFSETTHPVNLAIFRIALFAALFFYTDVSQIIQFSGFPHELRVAPFGIGWLIDVLPIDPASATAASYLFLTACVCGMLGFFSRTSAAAAVVLGFYVLGIPQFFGKIDHYHHLLWFAAILAVSPCGDALSLDAVIARRRGKENKPSEPSPAYALPLKFVMLLMGIIYFFAGFWKFVIGGFGWATSDTMKYILYAQWFRLDWMPALRIDQYPLVYRGAGVGVMLFELAFIFLLFWPRLRKVAAISGMLFHISVYLFAHINFWTLGLCYVVFIDFEPLRRLLITGEKTPTNADLSNHHSALVIRHSPTILIGTFLLLINTLCGLALIDSWPFAVYPTFASVQEKYLQSLTIVLRNPDGTTTELIPYKERSFQTTMHPSRLIGLFTQVLWAKDSMEVRRRGVALLEVLERYDDRLRQASSIRLYIDVCSVLPEEQAGNPVRRELLFTVER